MHTNILSRFWNHALDFLFPERCIGCGKTGEIWCVSCRALVPCELQKTTEDTYAATLYAAGAVKKALWKLKYGGKREIAAHCAALLHEAALHELSELAAFEGFAAPLLVPVPVSKETARKRGFNQSALIAERFAERASGGTWRVASEALAKTKETPRQASLKKRGERLSNLRGAFAVADRALVRGKHILLIDDITTTGATFAEARRALAEAGAARIIALAVAH